MLKKFILGLTVIVLGFASCKKEEDFETLRERYLTEGIWQVFVDSAYLMAGGALIQSSDVYYTYPACLKDDSYEFMPNGELFYNQGNNLCTPELPASMVAGTYEFVEGDTKLSMMLASNPSASTTYNIQSLTADTMVLVDLQFSEGTESRVIRKYKNIKGL